jgi:hypothetical protein
MFDFGCCLWLCGFILAGAKPVNSSIADQLLLKPSSVVEEIHHAGG